ncbi:MAG: hemolysin family protein [Bacteroidales bacterium]|nr:hemolysin family protein [Bacteroidales bacterium]
MSDYLIILITLIFSAFFSGMEMAFISANKLRIELERKQGSPSSRIVSIFYKNPAIYITTMLVGNNIALVIYGLIMAAQLEPIIERFIQNDALILLIQTVLSTLLILITAEFLPKTVFRSIANTSLNVLSYPLLLFFTIFYPITLFINWLSDIIIMALRGSKSEETNVPHFNKLDLSIYINQLKQGNENEESDEENEIKLFQNALDFSSVKVRDCMIPRTEIKAIDINDNINELKTILIETGLSKILVYKNEPDNVVGYVTSKSLFKKPKSVADHLIDILYVPEAMPANKLLQKFIQNKKGIAVVVDEFGGISGMLTIEDIIEEIIGEIEDEYDNTELIEKQINEDEYILAGRLEIDYINEKYGLNIPESDEYDTLAGYIIYHHENIPELNEKILIEPNEFKILKVSKTKIDLLHLTIK